MWHERFQRDPETMGSNPSQIELGGVVLLSKLSLNSEYFQVSHNGRSTAIYQAIIGRLFGGEMK